jgi:hypothetical protein
MDVKTQGGATTELRHNIRTIATCSPRERGRLSCTMPQQPPTMEYDPTCTADGYRSSPDDGMVADGDDWLNGGIGQMMAAEMM